MRSNTRNDSTNGVNNALAVSHGPPATRCSYPIMLFLLAASMFWFSACSGTTPEDDNVVDCEGGGVKVNGGECKNPDTCGDKSCLPGYKCNDSKTCEIEFPCQTNDECGGLAACEAGRCVNPKKCQEDTNCLKGYQCDEEKKTCVPSKCSTHCLRGMCSSDGTCVSKAACTEEDEKKTCVEGELCVNGKCKTKEEICNDMGCGALEPGVCEPAKDRNHCVSIVGQCTALQCKKDEYCDNGTKCIPNNCAKTGVCSNGGECTNKKTGDCVDKENCQIHADCVGGKKDEPDRTAVCVKATKADGTEFGKCSQMNDEEIRKAACKGSQTLESIDKTGVRYVVTCKNAMPCRRKDDCTGDKICNGETGKCVPPTSVSCNPDHAEDNNDLNQAKDVNVYAGVDHELTLCGPTSNPADVDYFKFTPSALVSPSQDGEILVSVLIDPTDVGNKKITVKLLDSNRDIVAGPANSWDEKGSKSSVNLRYEGPFTDNALFVEISNADDDTNKAQTRLRYKLNVSAVNSTDSDSCEQLEGEEPVTGGMLSGAVDSNAGFKQLMPKCRTLASHTPINSPYDKVHKLLVEKRGSYHFVASATSNAALDLNVSIRRVCDSDDSELDGSCHDEKGAGLGVREDFYTVLDPGIYYVVVSSKVDPVPGGDGAYSLAIDYKDVACEPSNNKCVAANSSSGEPAKETICNEAQTEAVTTPCTHGCDGNECAVFPGDTCKQPLAEISFGHAFSNSKIELEQMSNTYDAAASCRASDDAWTKGKDVVVKATVEPNEVLIARAGSVAGATIYFTTDCVKQDKGCFNIKSQSGRSDITTASFINDKPGAKTETVYVIIDHPETSSKPPYFTAEVMVLKKMCEPNSDQCFKDYSQSRRCDSTGAGYVDSQRCNFKCKEGAASSPRETRKQRYGRCYYSEHDDCYNYEGDAKVGAVIDSSKTSFSSTEYVHLLDDDVNVPNGVCGDIATTARGGKDAIYKVLVGDNQYAEVEVTSDLDMKVWAVEARVDENDLNADGAYCDKSDTGRPADRESNRYKLKGLKCFDGSDHHDPNSPEKLYIVNKSSGEKAYYVIVEPSSSQVTAGEFKVKIGLQGSGKNADANTNKECASGELTYYDRVGLSQTVKCKAGCVLGKYCDNTTDGVGDSCHLPKILYSYRDASLSGTTTATESGNLTSGKYSNKLGVFKHDAGSCFFDRNKTPSGNEAIYLFDLKENDALSINVTKATGDIGTFFQEECGNIASKDTSCTGAINGLGERELGYYASKDKQVFFVVKQADETASEFEFEWKVEHNKTCAPNTYSCLSETELQICDDKGAASTVKCPCKHNSCAPETVTKNKKEQYKGDTCSAAQTIDHAGVYIIERDMATKTQTPSCAAGQGNDVFFHISPKPATGKPATGKVVSVKIHAIESHGVPVAYMFKSCDDLPKGKCIGVNSKQESDGTVDFHNYVVIEKYVPAGESIYLAVDEDIRYNQATPSDTYVEIEFLDPECTSNGTTCDNTGVNGTLTSCVDHIKTTYDCSGKCGPDSCVNGTGNTCFDSIDLIAAGGSDPLEGRLTDQVVTSKESHDLISLDNQRDGFSGLCSFEETTKGPELYYHVNLDEGDLLTVDFSREAYWGSQHLYVIEGCLEKKQTCLAMSREPGRDQTLKFRARKKGMYYLVVDTTGKSDEPFTLDYKIEKAVQKCIPMDSYCDDKGTQVTVCNPDGEWSKPFKCPNSSSDTSMKTCQNGRCVIDSDKTDKFVCDTKSDMVEVGDGFIGTIPLVQQAYHATVHDIRGAACISGTFSSWDDQKRDAFFYLGDLKPSALVEVYLTRPGKYEQPIVYFFTDCTDPAGTCEAAGVAESVSLDTLKATYLNPTGKDAKKTVFIGVTTSKGWGLQSSPTIYVKVQNPDLECVNQTFVDKCIGNQLQYCDEDGFKQLYDCQGSNVCRDDSTTDNIPGVCAEPVGDSCIDPKPLDLTQTMPITITDTFSGFQNTSTLTHNNTCTAVPQYGPDRFYTLKLEAGKTLTAKVESMTGPKEDDPQEDLSIYLTDTCKEIEDRCLAGSDQYGAGTKKAPVNAEELTYQNNTGETQTLRLVVDSAYATAKGKFKLTVDVQ